MSAADTSERLLSIAEFAALDSGDEPTELVRGKVVTYRCLYPIQGVVTVNVSCAILKRVEDLGLGEMTLGGVGVITGRNPDTVRAAKVAYFSYLRNSNSFLQNNHWEAIPDLGFENPSPDDSWSTVIGRVVDFLHAGVIVVGVVDFPNRFLQIFRSGRAPLTLTAIDDLNLGKILPESMPGCVVPVSEFFDD